MKMTEKAVVDLVKEFLQTNKGVEDAEWRKNLVDEFTEEIVVKMLEDGYKNPMRDLQRWKMVHPDFLFKSSATQRYQNVLTILSDYIMKIDQRKENKAEEFPIHKLDKEYRAGKSGRELPLVLGDDVYDEELAGKAWNMAYETDFNNVNPVEDAVIDKDDASTVESFADLIRQVKLDPEPYVKKYADSQRPWNDKKVTINRTPNRVRWAIRTLEERRITECRVCGGAFYRHDLRQEICDILPSMKFENKSVCQCLNNQYYSRNYGKSTI